MHEVPVLKSAVPVGVAGRWRIERFAVPVDPGPNDTRPQWAQDPAGTYTRLMFDQVLFMTDLYPELWTQRAAVAEAGARGGHVLITGLGLGLVAEAMLLWHPGAVKRITIVEHSADVAALVAPHLEARYGSTINVVVGDAFAYTPPTDAHYTVGWHDIWPTPQDPVALREGLELEERFSPWCDWQGSWPTEFVAAEREAAQR